MPPKYRLRSHGFFFTPRDYLNDPVVLAMSTLARGAYSTLLFAIWDLDEPGVVFASDDALRALARATMSEWLAVKEIVALAFDTETRKSYWIQKRMVLEHIRQQRFYALKSRIGKAGRAKQLAGRGRADPGQTPGASQASQASQAKSKTTHPPLSKDLTPAISTPENGAPPPPAPVGGFSIRSVPETPHPTAAEQLAALARHVADEGTP